jgi:hypothetical protein
VRTERLVAWILCLSASGQVWGTDRVVFIPRPFTGEWDAVVAACASREGDGHLTISARNVSLYESGGAVRSVRVQGPRGILVVADMSGEGERWVEPLELQLSKDSNSLSLVMQGQRLVYHRCAVTRAQP